MSKDKSKYLKFLEDSMYLPQRSPRIKKTTVRENLGVEITDNNIENL